MKRFISILIAVIAVAALMAVPVSAASLGISPSHIEVEVPSGGSASVNFQVHYFNGDLYVSLVDIPLEVEPTIFHITSSPTDIVVTLRDSTLSPQEYDGYVRFLGMSQDTVALAVNIGARVTVELSANIVEEPTPPTGGGRISITTTKVYTDLFGEESSFRIDKDGEVQKTVEATSKDGNLTITIPEGTIALDEEGEPLESLEIAVDETPPDPPEDAHVIGLAYDFGPAGATFDPPITMTYTLDLDDLPEGVAPEDLVIAYWDGDEWVELDSEVDIENSTITIIADVEHFTTFAVIGAVAPPPEEVTPPPEEVAPPPEEIAPPPEEVAPPEEVVPPAPPPEEIAPTNWPVLGGIIAGVIVVGLLIFFLVRRRRAY